MKRFLIVFLILILLGIAAGVLVYFFVYNKPHKNIEKARPDFVLTAEGLYKSFINDTASVARYSDKVIELTGTLDEVTNKHDTLVVLNFIFSEGMFGGEGVHCTLLPEYNARALILRPGSEVKLKGLCQGYNEGVILEKCSILE